MLRLLKYFLSKSTASRLECLTDNSGDVNRSIYSNLCLDGKIGYQHECPHLDADSSGQPGRPPAPPAPRPSLFFDSRYFSHLSPEELGILSFFIFVSELSFSLALKMKFFNKY